MIMVEPLVEFNLVTARVRIIKDTEKYSSKMFYFHKGDKSELEVLNSEQFGLELTERLGDDAEFADSICVKIRYSNYSLN